MKPIFTVIKFIFWNKEEKRLRMTWRLLFQSFLMGMLLVASQILISLITFLFFPEILPLVNEFDIGFDQPLLMLYSFLINGLVITVSVWLSGLIFDRRRFLDFGFKLNRQWWLDFAFGLILGIVLMTGIFLFELSLGWIKVTNFFVINSPDATFLPSILIPLILFISVGFYEELFSRGYQLTNLAEGFSGKYLDSRWALILASIISSGVFGLMHASNPNANLMSTLNICLAGIFLAAGYILTGQLAIPIGLHISWNFVQGNVFGFPVSGGDFRAATIVQIDQFGPDLWTGGLFGPEGGLIGSITTIIGTLIILAWTWRRSGKFRLQSEISEYPRGKRRAGYSRSQAETNLITEPSKERPDISYPYTHIIWDWNGTLLDDIQLCLRVINTLLSKRDLPTVSKNRYLEIFGFPVQDYYQKLGFDFSQEPFETISTEFITAYEAGRSNCPLMPDAWNILDSISKMGIAQSILSASKKDYLDEAVLDYGLEGIFCAVQGLDNHHAAGKAEIAQSFMTESDLDPKRVLLIGDTIHDGEIAREIGVDCWLIPNGHQSRHRLSSLNLPLLRSLVQVEKLISSHDLP